MSLRLRLSLAAGVLLATLALVGVFLVSSVQRSEINQVDQELRSAFPATRAIHVGGLPAATHRVVPHQFSADHVGALYIAAVAGGRRTVFSTPLGAHGATPALPRSTSVGTSSATVVTVGSLTGSGSWRAVLLVRPGGDGELLVAAPLSGIEATLGSLRLALLAVALVVLAVVAATGFWVGRLGLGPIEEVTEVATAIAAGDRTRRVRATRSGTEAARLAEAFNAMRDEQLALESRLRQFVADASHELRSPVAAIQGITELWRRGELQGEAERAEALRRIGRASQQMSRLVEELLLLARLDEGRALVREPVDLAAVVREVVDQSQGADPARPIRLDVDPDASLEADGSSLRRMVTNLVTNALRHTPPTSAVSVRLAVGDAIELEVGDEGPGMTPEEAAHAFDRFWQADAARSRQGAGLGLPIVRGIVAAHGGDVTLDSDPVRGTRVVVRLPRPEPAPA